MQSSTGVGTSAADGETKRIEMSFSRKVKDELVKKDFTVTGKEYKITSVDNEQTYIRKYLRDKFLEAGSVTDPNKDYHLEFICQNQDDVGKIMAGLQSFGLHPKTTERGKHPIVYLKDASEISDVLNIVGAHSALMDFENVRILKEVSENVNRRVNFETANINRTVRASIRQTEDIRLIQEKLGFKNLEPGLREIAEARLRNPGASLEELAAGLENPIGKSGANHRMRKLARLAADLRKKTAEK